MQAWERPVVFNRPCTYLLQIVDRGVWSGRHQFRRRKQENECFTEQEDECFEESEV